LVRRSLILLNNRVAAFQWQHRASVLMAMVLFCVCLRSYGLNTVKVLNTFNDIQIVQEKSKRK